MSAQHVKHTNNTYNVVGHDDCNTSKQWLEGSRQLLLAEVGEVPALAGDLLQSVWGLGLGFRV